MTLTPPFCIAAWGGLATHLFLQLSMAFRLLHRRKHTGQGKLTEETRVNGKTWTVGETEEPVVVNNRYISVLGCFSKGAWSNVCS